MSSSKAPTFALALAVCATWPARRRRQALETGRDREPAVRVPRRLRPPHGRAVLRAQGWSPRVKLGPELNVNGTEIGALFSPSGRSLLFSRATKAPESGEFLVWHADGSDDWPPACPASGKRPAQ